MQDETLPLVFPRPVTLAGGGVMTREMLDEALALAPELVAADGAADRLAELGLMPAAVIGDMDSIADPARWRPRVGRLVALAEQDTTDFEKCLYATDAPFYIGVGFTGGRVDHQLAVLHAMLARPEKRVLLLGEADVMALLPPGRVVRLDLEPGARVSFFPLAGVRGVHSRGLAWPIEGLAMAPAVRIGTSNRATTGPVEVAFEGPGALAILERSYLVRLLAALQG